MTTPFWWHQELTDGVHGAFTSAEFGNLALHAGVEGQEQRQEVVERRRELERHMGVPEGSLRFLNQVHSADVQDASKKLREEPATGDAWVSSDGAQPLAVMVADCLPVLLVGSMQGPEGAALPVTAAAHAGRPGLLAGILENTVHAMRERGAQGISAWIGPGACRWCYEIPAEMVDQIAADRPLIRSRTHWGTAALDLRTEAERILKEADVGVAPLSGCTIEDSTLYSHRRNTKEGTPQGRFAGIVWKRS